MTETNRPGKSQGAEVMELELAGQVGVVFGGARGIGHAIARRFAEEGMRVVIADVDPGSSEGAKALGHTTGAWVKGLVVDASDGGEVGRLAAEVFDREGQCDHVVYAAGVGSGQFGMPFWMVDAGLWERVLRVNLIGAVHMAHAFGPWLAERGRGTMLFLGSVAGQFGSPTDPPYSASKAGLLNFMQCAARDLAAFGVRVNAINPGMVKTPLNRAVWEAWNARQPEGARQDYESWTAAKIQRMVPLNRWQEPEDVAAMAAFLASERARNVTGQAINVDGGFVMHT